jgi:hypothetical protein
VITNKEKTEALGQQTCPSSTLYVTHPTWNDLEANPVFYSQKTNDLGYSMQIRFLALTEHVEYQNPS